MTRFSLHPTASQFVTEIYYYTSLLHGLIHASLSHHHIVIHFLLAELFTASIIYWPLLTRLLYLIILHSCHMLYIELFAVNLKVLMSTLSKALRTRSSLSPNMDNLYNNLWMFIAWYASVIISVRSLPSLHFKIPFPFRSIYKSVRCRTFLGSMPK